MVVRGCVGCMLRGARVVDGGGWWWMVMTVMMGAFWGGRAGGEHGMERWRVTDFGDEVVCVPHVLWLRRHDLERALAILLKLLR